MKQKKNNIIFLDIDGVLNYTRWFQGLSPYHCENETELDPVCIERVKILCDLYDMKIVITSDWRLDMENTIKRLSRFGLGEKYIIGKTPDLLYRGQTDRTRGHEIKQWLFKHDCDNYGE